MTFTLKSSAFKHGDVMPAKHTCDGDNVNPLLEIHGTPSGTVSLALVVDDPDATRGTPWDHWILWNVHPRVQYISEDSTPEGTVLGTTSFGKLIYGGPCPPRDSGPHRYFFKLYALDALLDLPEGATKEALEMAMKGHVLDETALVGLYARHSDVPALKNKRQAKSIR